MCIVDFVYPPKKSSRQSFSESQDNLAEGVEDLATEDIEDDDEAATPEDDEQNSDDAEEDQEDDEDEEEDEVQQENKEETGDTARNKKVDSEVKPNNQAGDEAPEITDKPSTEQVRKRKPRKD